MGLRGIPEAEIIFEDMAVPADLYCHRAACRPLRVRSALVSR
jgi:hypothetical protein